jgi:tetratricopeptide (TPR) repeat protein
MRGAAVEENLSLESLVVQVADEFVERHKRGEQPDAEEYAARYPHWAEVIRKVLAALPLIRLPGVEVEGLAGRLGDYRILREVGRGGMGVVYEAEQLSLGRRVALKVLPLASAMSARQLQRFHNEAQAAALLHHPNIVPVHAVGCEGGVHFYAMQFIDGRTLAEVIAELRCHQRGPAAFEEVARLGVQVALALEHAHQEGIIHRDIKPGNLLLDQRGNLWITDFGLARLHNDTSLTLSGDLMGTLRYMSPEQALGHPAAVDHRTDVYALGATLYELVSLCPVFDGRDRQELLRQIAEEEPRPPRRLNKTVPTELETIVLKALAKDPTQRYATARELAGDLERFLRDEPVLARRPTLLQRWRRWARRHRAVVWSIVAGKLVTLAVLAGSVGWVARDKEAQQARTAAEVQVALDEAQRLLEERNGPQAQAAVRRAEALVACGCGREELRWSVRELRAELRMTARLEEIRMLPSRVKDGRFDSAAADREYARAFREYGIDVETLDHHEAARRIAARTIRVELAAALDGWAQTRRWFPKKRGKSWRDLLAVAREADDDRDRTALRDAVLRGDAQALVKCAAPEKVRALPPVTLVLLAEYLKETRGIGQATALLRQAQEQHRGDFWINHQLACFLGGMGPLHQDEAIRFYTAAVALRPESPGACLNLGVALAARGRRAEALAAFDHAIELKHEYAEAHVNRGIILCEMGKQDRGIAVLRKAIELKPDLAEAHGNLGIALVRKERFKEAVAVCRTAVRLFASRQTVAWKPELATAHNNLGIALRGTGRLDEAIKAFRKAVELKPDLALAHNNLGHALIAVDRLDEAAAALRTALELNRDYAEAHDGLGKLLASRGHFDEAITAFRRAIALKPALAEAHCNLGVALVDKGRPDEAIAAYRQAIALKPALVTAHLNLGRALSDEWRLDEAIAVFRKRVDLESDSPGAHHDLGCALWKKGRVEEAIASYRRAIALKPDYAEAHCNLGFTLRHQGQFAGALAATKRGHELGSSRRGWSYPSDQWVQECRLLVDLAGRDRGQLRSTAERNGYAQLCYYTKRYVAAAGLWAEVFTAQPKLADDLQAAHRYRAACAAVLAGCGKGKYAEQLTDKECSHWRRQALTWLRADLAVRTRQLHSGKQKDRVEVKQELRHWQSDPNLSGLRDPATVARLPAGEREACKQFWSEVQALLVNASAAR